MNFVSVKLPSSFFYRHVIYMYVNYEVKYTYIKDTAVKVMLHGKQWVEDKVTEYTGNER